MVALAFFSYLKIQSVKKANKYPESTDCTEINMLFETSDSTSENPSYNVPEYVAYAKIDKASTMNSEGTGVY